MPNKEQFQPMKQMLGKVFTPSPDTATEQKTRLVTLDQDGHPEYQARHRVGGGFVYAGRHPLRGHQIPEGVQVVEQTFINGKWVASR